MFLLACLSGHLAGSFPLTIESIMRGPALVGKAPRELRWSQDGSQLSFSWGKADGTADPEYHQFHVNKDGTGLAPGAASETAQPQPKQAEPAKPTVTITNGDIFLADPATATPKQITHSTLSKRDPRLVDGGQSIVFFSGDDLYRAQTADGSITRLTQIQAGDQNSPTDPNAVVIKTPKGYRNGTLTVTPDGDHAFILFSEEVTQARRADVPRYVTTSGYPEVTTTYPRPGAPQAQSKALILDLKNGTSIDVTPIRPARTQGLRWSPAVGLFVTGCSGRVLPITHCDDGEKAAAAAASDLAQEGKLVQTGRRRMDCAFERESLIFARNSAGSSFGTIRSQVATKKNQELKRRQGAHHRPILAAPPSNENP